MPGNRAYLVLGGSADHRLDFERASALAGVEPTRVHRVGDVRRAGRPWSHDNWDYHPGGDGIGAQIDSSLSIVDPHGEFAAFVRTLEFSKLMIVAETSGKQSFKISRDAIAKLQALGADVDGDLYWKGAPTESDAVADVGLAYRVNGATLATDPATTFEYDDRHFERRVEAFARRIAYEMSASAIGSPNELAIDFIEHAHYQSSCYLALDADAIAALAVLNADVIVTLEYRPASSRA